LKCKKKILRPAGRPIQKKRELTGEFMKAIRLKSTRSFCVPILALSLFQFSTAQAQTDSSGASTGQLQEIIVTAQKREQRLDDVGMTISVVSADEIRSEGITDVNGLAKVTSGFVVG
jgi:iron complex outermembrane receptor protein